MFWTTLSILSGMGLVGVFLFMLLWMRQHNLSKSEAGDSSAKRQNPVPVLMVVGSGGHTREILTLAGSLDRKNYSPRYYVIAETDSMSEAKVRKAELERADCNMEKHAAYEIFFIPRSREVKQSYLTSVLTTLRAIFFSIPLVFKLKPELILCNGPGTCIPICLLGFLLKLTGLQKTMVVYVESLCRVTSLSLSGKILYHFADAFFVQWPEMLKKYPKAKYLGRLV